MQRKPTAALSLSLCFLLTSLPALGGNAGLIGIGRASGPAEINGSAYSDGSNLYAGDHIHTGSQSRFLLLIAPQEKSVLAPDSIVRLSKEGENVVLSLTEGKVTMQTAGRTQIVLADHDLQVHPVPNSSCQIEVEILNDREASVFALQGPVRIVGGNASVVLNSGETALVTDNTLSPPPLDKDASFTRSRDLTLLIVAGSNGEAHSIRFTFFSSKRHNSMHKPHDDN